MDAFLDMHIKHTKQFIIQKRKFISFLFYGNMFNP